MKNTIKLLIALILCLGVVISLASCEIIGTTNQPSNDQPSSDNQTNIHPEGLEIVEKQVFAYNARGERVDYDHKFIKYDNNTYYVVNNFVVVGDYVIEGMPYTFDENGVLQEKFMHKLFINCEGATYYVENNMLVRKEHVIEGALYNFDSDGKMITGEFEGYIFGEDGKLVADKVFVTINNNTYYLINNTVVIGDVVIYGHLYNFNKNGKMFVGEKNGYTYGEDGKLIADKIFVTINNNTYYLENNSIVFDQVLINGSFYHFDENGEMFVGEKNGFTYGEDGKLVANEIFLTINNNVYYFIGNTIVLNSVVIDGHLYDFGDNGVMFVGEKDGLTYGEDGKLIANEIFVTINNNTYYLINNVILVNVVVIDGNIYDFGDDGKMVIGTNKDGFTFGEDGKLVADKIFITINNNTYYLIGNVIIYNFGDTGEDGDVDGDGLSNRDEIAYTSDPFNPDTDGDGASDGKEVKIGFSPVEYNSSFGVVTPPVVDNGDEPDTVVPTIEVELSGDQVDSLVVERDDFFDKNTLGYLGDAYNYDVEGEIESATIGFEFDENKLGADALPTIYAYNRETNIMTPLATTVENGKATAEVDEFATFVLLDRKIYEEELTWVDTWGIEGGAYSSVEIVFVIDDSGSMDWNDGSNKRLSVACDLINKLPEGSKIGIVKFESSTTIYTNTLVDNKETAKGYLTTSYFRSSGGTYMFSAMNKAYSLFSAKEEGDGVMRVMVVLSDGETADTGSKTSAINNATSNGVSVYTVGLGSSTSYFNSYMKPVSEATGGKFYLASDASGLADIFTDIGDKIDLTTDYDGDGLLDYYEDNMVIFSGVQYYSDKTKADTDGDGLLDGEEIKTVVVLSVDGTKMTVLGKVYSNPSLVDTDGDGVSDKEDSKPLDALVA